MEPIFSPKLFTTLKAGYSRHQFTKDVMAGIIVGIVALPLAIAFAIASGVGPEKGLLTAIVAGFLISILGGSRVQIGGPTGAFVVIVAGIIATYGIEGLIISTIMAGIIMVIFGLFRLGVVIRFIPYPLVVGFTSGIALLIFVTQIKDFFGLQTGELPADFIGKVSMLARSFHSVNWVSLVFGLGSLLLTLFWGKISSRIPGSLIALLGGALLVAFGGVQVETIGTKFGEIPSTLSLPTFPNLSWDTIYMYIGPAFTIALLGSIESLLSAVVSDGMIGGRHRSNTELIAQGTANCASAMFGGIPATGAIARTATNVNNGGRTPIAGIVHAIVLLLIMLIFAPLAKLIPMACLAGILIVVSYHMSEWRQFKSLLKGNKYDILILLVTFFLTVVFDLVIAIQIGIVLSSFILMRRMSESLHIKKAMDLFTGHDAGEKIFEEEQIELPKGVIMYEISGALFFGAAQTFQDTISQIQHNPKVLILRIRYVPFIDATGIYRLKELIAHFKTEKVQIIISGAIPSVRDDLEKGTIFSVLPEENMVVNIHESVKRAEEILKTKKG